MQSTMNKNSNHIRLTNLPILFDSLKIETLPADVQEKIARIDGSLPQTQCGLCDHADGCLPYAVAIVMDGEPHNKCVRVVSQWRILSRRLSMLICQY